jgi:hypothetical protein
VNTGYYVSVHLNKDQQALHTPKQTSHLAERISVTTDPISNYTRHSTPLILSWYVSVFMEQLVSLLKNFDKI